MSNKKDWKVPVGHNNSSFDPSSASTSDIYQTIILNFFDFKTYISTFIYKIYNTFSSLPPSSSYFDDFPL